MNRLLVSLLAAFDALIVVAVGLAVVLAPVTLLWVLGIGGAAEWSALWPAAATVWQAGHFAPVAVVLPPELIALAGLSEDASTFTVSLAPTALALFTAVFAWRSGGRAARAGAWATGVLSGSAVVAVLAAVIALTGRTDVAVVDLVPAVVGPALVFLIPATIAAVVRAWNDGDGGIVDALSERLPDSAQDALDAAARGIAICLAGFVGVGAVVLAALFVVRGGEVVALTQAAHADAVGVIVLSLGTLLWLPTLVVWFAGFAAGPGFAVGTGTGVAPAGTSLGVVPGIPAFGVVPDSTSTWMLLLVLLVVGLGALAGLVVRGLLPTQGAVEPLRPRIVALIVVAAGTALGAAVLAWAAQGSLGPGRLSHVGPEPGWVALAVAVEIGAGAAITLLSPRGSSGERDDQETRHESDAADVPAPAAAPPLAPTRAPAPPRPLPDDNPTTPLD